MIRIVKRKMPCNKDLANESPDVLGDVWTDWRQYQCLKLNELEDKVAVHPCWLQLTILVTCSLAMSTLYYIKQHQCLRLNELEY